jgi:flagellar hook-associated protein 2
LRDAINSAGAGVSASILTSGSNHYLSISAANPGQAAIQLHDIPKVNLVTNTGSGSETSLAGYADPAATAVSATGKIDLVVGSTTYHLDITAANNLNGLVNAINTTAGAGLTAGISNVAGINYLTVSGASSVQLNDLQTPVNLISTSNAGSNADFMLNTNIHVVRSSNTVNDMIPGVSFTVKNTTAPTGSVTLSLATDQNQLANTLQTFVTSYNSLVDQLNTQKGAAAGPLGGDMLITNISSDMHQLASYWNNGNSTIHSLSDLGVTFEDTTTGHLTFNPSTLASLSATNISDAYKFLGSSNAGFAQLASNFTQLSDPLHGQIRLQENSYDTADARLTDQIAAMTHQATQARNTLTAKIQAADALVAQLQSQQSNVSASLNSLNFVLYGRQTNVNGL